MKPLQRITVTTMAIVGLLASSLGAVGVPNADAITWGVTKEDDPDYNTPGFPLPRLTEPNPISDFEFVPAMDNDVPALIQPLNDGGFRTDAPHFVSIGDSYTTTAFYGTTLAEPCFHNAIGFSYMVSKETGLPVRDAACAGANMKHYWHTGNSFVFPVPKRAQRLTIDRNSKLVVVSLGGNNVYADSMLPIIGACAVSWLLPPVHATYNPCERISAPELIVRMKSMLPALTYMYQDAKQRAAKDAVVIAMGYFSPLPDDTTNCWISRVAPEGDIGFLQRIFGLLNRQIRKAAKAAGVLYYNPSAEREAVNASCGAPFLRTLSLTGFPEVNVPLHPTLSGHWMMGKGVADLYKRELAARKRGTTIAPSTWRTSATERHYLRSAKFARLKDWRQGPPALDQMTLQEYHAKYWNAPNHDELDKQIARERKVRPHHSKARKTERE